MKALSMTAPWGMFIRTGDKSVETRSWYMAHRGVLAIHLAKTIPAWAREWYQGTPAAQTMLLRAGYEGLDDLPLGCIVATCQATACVRTESVDWTRVKSRERLLGDFSAGRYALLLQDVMPVNPPVPATGMLGFWNWDAEAAGVEALVTARLF